MHPWSSSFSSVLKKRNSQAVRLFREINWNTAHGSDWVIYLRKSVLMLNRITQELLWIFVCNRKKNTHKEKKKKFDNFVYSNCLFSKKHKEVWSINKPLQWKMAQRTWARATCLEDQGRMQGVTEVASVPQWVVSVLDKWLYQCINCLYQLSVSTDCVNGLARAK